MGVVGLATAGACRSTATDPGNSLGLAGTYELVSVNTAPLPYQDPNDNTFVVRGSLVIHGSPRYDLVETDSAAGATSNLTSSGQWNVSSNALTLKGSDGTFYFGLIVGNKDTARVQLGTHLGTYVRQ
ncbi:MAG: hypothetical protein ACRENQ_02075 [Gemmatimonadaceae bacterium]